jgi:hypothetical protein
MSEIAWNMIFEKESLKDQKRIRNRMKKRVMEAIKRT